MAINYLNENQPAVKPITQTYIRTNDLLLSGKYGTD